MLKVLSVFLLCATLSKVILAQNYCKQNLCPAGKKHIACGNGNWAGTCPAQRNIVNIQPLRAQILHMHNYWRNRLAGGLIKRYRPAKRMGAMIWDKDLAAIAEYNVKQCQMKHDKCRNTATYQKAGQNLAIAGYTGPKNSKSNKALIKQTILSWWNEHKYCNMNIINSYKDGNGKQKIGHFTAFATERSNRIGCAIARYTKGKKHSFLIACNYASTNIMGKPVYVAGAKASGCKTGKDKRYPNLCSSKEFNKL